MINRSFDPELLRTISEDFLPEEYISTWINNPHNVLFNHEGSLGLATFEYPGLYTIHWFFKCRGREALTLARRMFKEMFEKYDAQVLRGFTPVENRAARWASRQVGLKSYGEIENATGKRHEMFMITKDEFYKQEKEK